MGWKIDQKSIKNGIEKTIEKGRAARWPTRRSKSLRRRAAPPARAQGEGVGGEVNLSRRGHKGYIPTRLAPHSWRADPWSYILAPPPLACQASKPPLAQGLLLGLPRNYDCSRQAASRTAEELQLSDIWTSRRWMLFSHTWLKEQG